MLQPARSSDSKSFLRELEDALTLVKDDKARKYFLNQMSEVLKKRKDTSLIFTGEKDLKSELLSYLKQFGYVKTANVWARNVPMDRSAIDKFLVILQQRLLDNDIQGILELHLQDREINSPHIQFIGIRTNEAEVIIAQTLVEFKYEISMESALGKKDFIPYYQYNSKARIQNLDDMLEYEESKQKDKEKTKEQKTDEFIKELDENLEELREIIKRVKSFRSNLSQRIENLQKYKTNLRKENHHLKRLRMRIGRR